MFFTRLEANDVSRPDLLDGPTLPLYPAEAECHDQSLTKRMRVPGSSSTWLERHGIPGGARWCAYREQWVDSHYTAEPFARSLS